MFFNILLIMFALAGFCVAFLDIFIPGFFVPIISIGLRTTGWIMVAVGVMLKVSRSVNTGSHLLDDLPKNNEEIVLLEGNSGGRLIKVKKDIINTVVGTAKIHGFKKVRIRLHDTGGNTRIAGHEFGIGGENIGYTVPLKILQYVHKIREKYLVEDRQQLIELGRELKALRDPDKFVSLEMQLEKIELMKPVLADEKLRKQILGMKVQDLRNMTEILYDGTVFNIKAYKDFDATTTPYGNEGIIDRKLAHRSMEQQNYVNKPLSDWGRLVIPITILIIGGALAYQMIAGGGA